VPWLGRFRTAECVRHFAMFEEVICVWVEAREGRLECCAFAGRAAIFFWLSSADALLVLLSVLG